MGLVGTGKRVILVDADPQGNLTVSLGVKQPDELTVSIDSVMQSMIEDRPVSEGSGIIRHGKNIDLLPANIELSGLEVNLFNTISREFVLKNALDPRNQKNGY